MAIGPGDVLPDVSADTSGVPHEEARQAFPETVTKKPYERVTKQRGMSLTS